MKPFSNFALILSILLTACGIIPGLSLTATPTSTPEPTSTLRPTDTPTPLPTATQDKTATAAAIATETSESTLAELDKLLVDTDIPFKVGHLAWNQTRPLSIDLSGPEHKILAIDDKLTAANFVLKSDVTWTASGLIICGAVFRSEPDLEKGRQYQFTFLRLSGLPAWAIDVFEFGRYKNSPSDVMLSSALDQHNEATNQFVLAVWNDQFHFYINQNREGRYFDYSKQRTEGSFGFLALQDSGKGSCEFENSWVWELD